MTTTDHFAVGRSVIRALWAFRVGWWPAQTCRGFQPMIDDELPHVANLFYAAGSVSFREVDISATGLGETREEAIALRNAEFAERRSFVLGPEVRCIAQDGQLPPGVWSSATLPVDRANETEYLAARSLGSGAVTWFPVRMISVGSRLADVVAEGTAAGSDGEMATLNAVREAIERHAARQWWLGLRAPAPPSATALEHFNCLQRQWRRHTPRRTELLDITPAFGVPVFAAWSCREDGRALCFGLACHPKEDQAVRVALKELYQMEFGLDVAAYRQRKGVQPAEREQRMLERAGALTVDDCIALLSPGRDPARPVEAGEPVTSTQLAAHLDRFGIALHAIDLPPTDARYQVVHAFSADLRLPHPPTTTQGKLDRTMPCWTGWDLYW